MIRILCAFLVALLFAPPVFAQQDTAPTVPAEAKQFDFLLGEWQLEVHPKVSSIAAMIHGSPKLVGTWKATRAFEGLGIEDDLRIVDASGNPISLTHASRIYAQGEKRWKISGLNVYHAQFSQSTATWQDNEMRVDGAGTDAEGKPYLARTHYSAITPDGFRMQQDRSGDNGQTWDEGVLSIEAKRVGAAAH